MLLRSLQNRRITRWLQARFGRAEAQTAPSHSRAPTVHVLIIDGTLSSLDPACIDNAGITYRLLQQMGSEVSLYYQPGLQWSHWRKAGDIIAGRGINRQIRAAYSWLASRYRPGDRIFLFGYSRGAYAVRSLAGIIDRVGLLRMDAATERNVQAAYRHYTNGTTPEAFRRVACHPCVPIEMIGVWDTVKALGLNLPLIWRLSKTAHDFHNHAIGSEVRHACHALARNETRAAYVPVMWETTPGHEGRIEQMWFRGTHGDVGGQLGGYDVARPLSNIPLVWMLDKAEAAGLPLPEGWRLGFPQDAHAPSTGMMRGAGRWLITRRARQVGLDPSERVHPSVAEARQAEQLPEGPLFGFLSGS